MHTDYSDVRTREEFLAALESDFSRHMRKVEYTTYNGDWAKLWSGKNDHVFWYHALLSYGDYDNSCQAERSNVRELIQYRYDGVFDHCRWISEHGGAHGWNCAGFVEDELPATSKFYGLFLEMLQSLEDYPVLNDDLMSEMEMEAECDAWDSWIESDLRRELNGRVSDDILDNIESADLWAIVSQAMDSANEYFLHESGGIVYLNIERILPAVIALLVADNG